jgi:hypothetical protein
VSTDPADVMIDALWGAVQDAGHLDCGGWSIDGRDGVLVCACGERLSAGFAPAAEDPWAGVPDLSADAEIDNDHRFDSAGVDGYGL